MRDPLVKVLHLGGGFKYFLFSPLFGEDSHFDDHIFSKGLKPPTSHDFVGCEKCPHPGWGGWDCWASP